MVSSRRLNLKMYDLTYPYSAYAHRTWPTLMTDLWKPLDIINRNKEFFEKEAEILNQEKYDQVIITYTAWPDYAMNDLLTRAEYPPAMSVLPIIQSYLNQGETDVVLDPNIRIMIFLNYNYFLMTNVGNVMPAQSFVIPA